MYFEEFITGQKLTTPERTVTGRDIDRFVELVGLDNPIFRTDDGAEAAGHTGRLVPGPLQLSLGMGLCQAAGIFDHVAAVAQFDELKFRRPVHPGDRLRMDILVGPVRTSRNPSRGVVKLDYRLLVNDGEPALTTTGTYLMLRRPS